MSDHIADLLALQHWRARAAELERERDEAKQRWGRAIDELGRVIKILAGTDDDVAAVNACQPHASDLARRVMAERDELRALLSDADERAHLSHGVAELAMKHRDAAERERDEARAEASEAYQLFPPLLQDIDHALNGPDPDEITRRSYVPLPARAREVMAALVESRALLRECRDWFNEGPDADRPDDLCARLDAALGGRDE